MPREKWNELHVLLLLLFLFDSKFKCCVWDVDHWPVSCMQVLMAIKLKCVLFFLSLLLFFFLHLANLQAFIFISLAMESVAGQIYCAEKRLWLLMAKVKDRPLNTRALKSTWTQPCTSLARKTVIALWQMANHQFVTIYSWFLFSCWFVCFLFYFNIINWIKLVNWFLFFIFLILIEPSVHFIFYLKSAMPANDSLIFVCRSVVCIARRNDQLWVQFQSQIGNTIKFFGWKRQNQIQNGICRRHTMEIWQKANDCLKHRTNGQFELFTGHTIAIRESADPKYWVHRDWSN